MLKCFYLYFSRHFNTYDGQLVFGKELNEYSKHNLFIFIAGFSICTYQHATPDVSAPGENVCSWIKIDLFQSKPSK